MVYELQRLTWKQKKQIKDLSERGFSLNRVSQTLKLPKSTVYYWVRKTMGRKIKQVSFNFNGEDLGEFLGAFAGDGYASIDKEDYKYNVLFFFNKVDKEYIKKFKKFLTRIFGKYPHEFPVEVDNKIILKFQSKPIFYLIKKYLSWESLGKKGCKARTIKLKKKKYSTDFIIGFLRGSLDSDGSLSKEKGAIFATTSPFLAKTIKGFLQNLGFKSKFKKRMDKRPNRHPIFIIRIGFPICFNLIKLLNPRNPSKNAPTGI